jgi:hypothetical protein
MTLTSSIDIADDLKTALALVNWTGVATLTVEVKYSASYELADMKVPHIIIIPMRRGLSHMTRGSLGGAHQVQIDFAAKLANGEGETETKAWLKIAEQVAAEVFKAGDMQSGAARLMTVDQELIASAEELAQLRQVSSSIIATYQSAGTP